VILGPPELVKVTDWLWLLPTETVPKLIVEGLTTSCPVPAAACKLKVSMRKSKMQNPRWIALCPEPEYFTERPFCRASARLGDLKSLRPDLDLSGCYTFIFAGVRKKRQITEVQLWFSVLHRWCMYYRYVLLILTNAGLCLLISFDLPWIAHSGWVLILVMTAHRRMISAEITTDISVEWFHASTMLNVGVDSGNPASSINSSSFESVFARRNQGDHRAGSSARRGSRQLSAGGRWKSKQDARRDMQSYKTSATSATGREYQKL